MSLSHVANATSTGSTIVIPATAAIGDFAILFDLGATNPADVVPTDWTQIGSTIGTNPKSTISYKKLVSGDPGATITGMNGVTHNNKLMMVFRSTLGITTITPSTWNVEQTSANPASQTVSASGQAVPLLVFGHAAEGSAAPTFSTASPAFDAEATGGRIRGGYKIYNSSPADHTIDMNDAGSGNTLRSGYILITETTVQGLTPSLFSNSNSFFTQTVTPGAVGLTPSLYTDPDAFFTQVVSTGPAAQDVAPSLFANSNSYFTQVFTTGVVNVAPNLYTDLDTFYTQVVDASPKITVVGSTSGAAAGGSNITLTFPGGVQQNDLIFVWGSFDSGAPSIVTAGYGELAASVSGELKAFTKRMGAAPDTEVVCTGGAGSNAAAYGLYVLRGVDPSVTLDVAVVKTSDNGTNPDAPSITTVTANALVIAIAGSAVHDTTITAPSGYTNLVKASATDTNPRSIGGATFEKTTAGAENPLNYTQWSGGVWDAITIAIRPGTGAAQSIVPALFSNSNSYYTQVISTGGADVAPSLFADADTFFTQVVTPGAINLAPSLFGDGETYYTQVVTRGAINLAPSLFGDGETYYTQVIANDTSQQLSAELYVDADTFYVPGVSSSNTLIPALFIDADTFYAAVVSSGTGVSVHWGGVWLTPLAISVKHVGSWKTPQIYAKHVGSWSRVY